MPTFDTPEPIAVRVEATAGYIRLVATDRKDTVVTVSPHDGSRPADVRAAEQTRVDYHGGKLAVAAPRGGFTLFCGGAIDIDIALPSHSRVKAVAASADVRADGEFADCDVSSASGNLDAENIQGNLKVAAASGGATIGELDGELVFKAASGDLIVARLCGDLRAKTASGSVTVAAAVRGSISAFTSSGEVGVGVADGTAARLDLITGSGAVTNVLEPADGPGEGDDTLLIQVRTASGDIDIHRAVRVPDVGLAT